MNSNDVSGANDIDVTGERYIPSKMASDVEVEHWHRYKLVAGLVVGKRVLDIASGEGYGSSLLSRYAKAVTGVDISAEAVIHARQNYGAENLQFLEGSCAAIPLLDASVDVVVSFETLEHHDQHEEMFREIKRVLVADGLCVISTPDRIIYSERTGYSNPYHVKELTAEEFGTLIARHFRKNTLLGQQYFQGSLVTGTANSAPVIFKQRDFLNAPDEYSFEPKYLIALASDGELPDVPPSVLEENPDCGEAARLMGLLQETARQVESLVVDRNAHQAAAADRTRERDEVASRLASAESDNEALRKQVATLTAERAALADRLTAAGSELKAPLVSKIIQRLTGRPPTAN